MKNYPDFETLCEEYQSGNITAVDFVTQQSDDITEEYNEFCKDNSIDSNNNESAKAFMDFREELFEKSIGY